MTNTDALQGDIWTEDEIGFIADAGSVGGDNQVGPSCSRRFWRALDDGTYAVIDSTYYVTVDYRELDEDGQSTGATDTEATAFERHEKFIDIVNQTESMICRDRANPGDSTISEESAYSNPYDLVPSDEEDAHAIAERLCRGESASYYS